MAPHGHGGGFGGGHHGGGHHFGGMRHTAHHNIHRAGMHHHHNIHHRGGGTFGNGGAHGARHTHHHFHRNHWHGSGWNSGWRGGFWYGPGLGWGACGWGPWNAGFAGPWGWYGSWWLCTTAPYWAGLNYTYWGCIRRAQLDRPITRTVVVVIQQGQPIDQSMVIYDQTSGQFRVANRESDPHPCEANQHELAILTEVVECQFQCGNEMRTVYADRRCMRCGQHFFLTTEDYQPFTLPPPPGQTAIVSYDAPEPGGPTEPDVCLCTIL